MKTSRRRYAVRARAFAVTAAFLAVVVGVARTCRTPAPPRETRSALVAATRSGFFWPSGAKAAVSITFDHAVPSQLDRGLPVLDAHGIKATFYPDIIEARKRLEDWRRARAEGHEIGNHSLRHPCSGDYRFERLQGDRYALESLTVEWMETDLLAANTELKRMFGAVPRTFSYPCGEMFTGRGGGTRSYVPVVARHFLAGRGFGLDFSNNPAVCDLAKVNSLAADEFTFEMFMAAIKKAVKAGDWVIFCGHGVAEKGGGYPSISPRELDKLCAWLEANRKEVWTGTVAEVAEYIVRERAKMPGKGDANGL